MIPALNWVRIGIYAALVALIFGAGYFGGWKGQHDKIISMQAVGQAEDERYRKLETETSDAQTIVVNRFQAIRAADRAGWDRIRVRLQSRAGGVPTVHAEPGSAPAPGGAGLEGTCFEADRGLPADIVTALESGETIERTLTLCQSELQACAALR